jgi:hypothetical protein
MKKLSAGLLLVSLLLGTAVLAAGAVPFFEAKNVLWTSTTNGQTGWLLIVNMTEGAAYNSLVVEAFTPFSIVDAECKIYSGGKVVATGLTDYMQQQNNTFVRIDLPVSIGYLDFVIVKLQARAAQAISLYSAAFASL